MSCFLWRGKLLRIPGVITPKHSKLSCYFNFVGQLLTLGIRFRLSSVYTSKHVNMGHDRDSDHCSSRTSPRLGSDHDGSSVKRPKAETNSDGDDLRQVSQLTRLKQTYQPRTIINLED